MPSVCPQCQQVYDQKSICPLCHAVLLYHPSPLQAGSSPHLEVDSSQWQQTPWGKIVVGLILAQGLGHGLRQLLTAGFVAGGDANVWGTLWGIVLLHSVHAFSLLVGGAITGAGQLRGIVYGSIVGVANGVLTLIVHGRLNESSPTMLTFAEPVMHLAMGALGGALGMLVWRPAPKIPEIEGSTTPLPQMNVAPMFGALFAGPIHMGRVCTGALLVVMGVVWSTAIMDFLVRASQGTLTISSRLQANLVSMEISALVVLLGSAFAGATTKNGLKQGLCVGLGAGLIVLGVQLSQPRFELESIVFTESGIVVIALVGGWFGSQLFPPLGVPRKRGYYDS